jgi:hypothetical protein
VRKRPSLDDVVEEGRQELYAAPKLHLHLFQRLPTGKEKIHTKNNKYTLITIHYQKQSIAHVNHTDAF